jgi:hypothetical protein
MAGALIATMYERINKQAILKSWHKLAFLLLIAGCFPEKEKPAASIYHWKTVFSLNAADSSRLGSLGIERLYVRFFDLDTDLERIIPKDAIIWKTLPPAHLEIVPCIRISNRSMRALPDSSIHTLARYAYTKIGKLRQNLINEVPEIQLDCDWTEETREKYFLFTDKFKAFCHADSILLSATIRLPQLVSPEKAGVPAADRAMLAIYNTGKIHEYAEANSILNPDSVRAAAQLISQYPLPLDLTLPLFSWAVQFRNGALHELHPAWSREELEKDTLFTAAGHSWLVVRENGTFKNKMLLKGDRIRVEEGSPGLCLEIIRLIADKTARTPGHLALFHYNPAEIDRYPPTAIKGIYQAWP